MPSIIRRDAITPYEADLLKKSLPDISARVAQHHARPSRPVTSTAAAAEPPTSKFHQTQSDLINPSSLEREQDSGSISLKHRMAFEPPSLFSHNTEQVGEFKYSVLSDEDEKSSVISTAVDSLHPSEGLTATCCENIVIRVRRNQPFYKSAD